MQVFVKFGLSVTSKSFLFFKLYSLFQILHMMFKNRNSLGNIEQFKFTDIHDLFCTELTDLQSINTFVQRNSCNHDVFLALATSQSPSPFHVSIYGDNF